MEERYLRVNDLRIRYVDKGRGKAVLLIHGLGGSIESWTNNIDEISRRMRVLALDLPGFGWSDKPKMSYTIKFYTRFIAEFVRLLGITRLSLVGSSLGGQIAAQVALSHPRLVRRLVLISPVGALPTSFKGTPALKGYVGVTKARSVLQVKQALHAVDSKPVDARYARLVYERLMMPGAKEAFLSALSGSANAPRLTSRLQRIRAPTLVVWGKQDIMIPVKFVEPFVRMKNCRVIMLEGCGHRPQVERPGLFNRLVLDFLKE